MKKMIIIFAIIVIATTFVCVYFFCFSRPVIKSSGNHSIKPDVIRIVGQKYARTAKDYIDYVVEWYNFIDVNKPVAENMNYEYFFEEDSLYFPEYEVFTEKEKKAHELSKYVEQIHYKILGIHSKRSETIDENHIKIERKAWKELKIVIEEAIDVFCIDG